MPLPLLLLVLLFSSLCRAELQNATWADLRSKVEDLTIVFLDSEETDQAKWDVINALAQDSTVYQVDRRDPANAEIFNNTFFSTDLPRLVTVVKDEMRAEYLEDADFTLENCREFIRLRFAPTDISDAFLYAGEEHISPRVAANETEAAEFHAREAAASGANSSSGAASTPIVYLFVSEKRCKTCPFFANAYLRFAGRHRGQAKFYVVDCDEHARFCFHRGVQKVPSVKLLHNDLLTTSPADTMIGMDKWFSSQLDPSQETAEARRKEHEELLKTLDEMDEEYERRKKELISGEGSEDGHGQGGHGHDHHDHDHDHDHTQDVMQQLTTPTRQKVIALEKRVKELEDLVAKLEASAGSDEARGPGKAAKEGKKKGKKGGAKKEDSKKAEL